MASATEKVATAIENHEEHWGEQKMHMPMCNRQRGTSTRTRLKRSKDRRLSWRGSNADLSAFERSRESGSRASGYVLAYMMGSAADIAFVIPFAATVAATTTRLSLARISKNSALATPCRNSSSQMR